VSGFGRDGGGRGHRPPGSGHQPEAEGVDHPLRMLHEDPRVALALYRKIKIQRKARAEAERAGAGTKIPTGGGAPLPAETRKRMEGQLGADLSGVSVHTGAESAKAADELGARAMTIGTDVHFGASEFAPGTKEGDRLLAHELAHVVQGQRSGVQRKADEGDEETGPEVSQPDEPAEKEADQVADQVAGNLHDGSPQGEASESEQQHGGEEPEAKEPTTQVAPALAAKLDPAKIHLAGKDPLRGSQRDQMGRGPEAGAMHVGNAVQAGVQKSPQHHVLPQEKRAWFAAFGVNVDEFCVNVDQAHHEALHKMGWNDQIMVAMEEAKAAANGKLTPKLIEKTARKLMATFKISHLPFVKYGSERPE
jgi:hypothetical protein